MDFEIVDAESADLDDILECWVALVEGQREYGSHIEAEPNRTVARNLLAQYIAGDMLSVARQTGTPDEEILGFVMYYREEGVYEQSVERGVIENIYVVPRARDNGIGSALLSEAESALTNRDVEVVAIAAMAENESAIEWYRSLGYESHRLIMERSLEDT